MENVWKLSLQAFVSVQKQPRIWSVVPVQQNPLIGISKLAYYSEGGEKNKPAVRKAMGESEELQNWED